MEKSPEAFRTISEVAEWLDTPAHVLRFWESRFAQVKPVKRAGGRRYYRPSDMALLGGIKKLLHEDGMTIRGVQKILRTEGVRHVAALSPPVDDLTLAAAEGEAAQAPETCHEAAAGHAGTPEPAAAPPPGQPPGHPPGQPPLPSHGPGDGRAAPAEASPAARAEKAQPEFNFDRSGPPADERGETGRDAADRARDSGAAAPAASLPPAPAPAAAPPDLSALPPLPDDDDPAFVTRPSRFPLADPRAVRARLAADPARAAALYARLVDLGARMGRPR